MTAGRTIDARGRPLRFLMLVLGGWTAWRVTCLDPGAAGLSTDAPASVALTAMAGDGLRWPWPPPSHPIAAAQIGALTRSDAATRASRTDAAIPIRMAEKDVVHPVAADMTPAFTHSATAASAVLAMLAVARYGTPLPLEAEPRRPARAGGWSASAWMIVREGSGDAGAGRLVTPQLGGSQAGVRLARSLTADGQLAVAGRVAGALSSRQQEAAVGVEWQPLSLPVRLVAEQRFGIANTRGGTTLGVVGGGTTALPGGGRMEGYGQAGYIARSGGEGYADGAVRTLYPLARSGPVQLDLGVGAWGAAQRGARRLDIGPSMVAVVPLGERSLRLALDWRHRVAGNARPDSGPALSIGTDF